MLGFLRKNEKIVLSTVAVIITFCFVFFGISGQPGMQKQREDVELGTYINGDKIKKLYLEKMSYFLGSSLQTMPISRTYINSFNDGVITEDFLKTKIAKKLVHTYFDRLKGELEARFIKMKRYFPYAHSQAPFISAKGIWGQIAPEILENLEKIQKKENFDEEVFSYMLELYLAQLEFTPAQLKQVLSYYQSQFSGVSPDPRIKDGDFSLFGFHSLTDWFGPSFIDLSSQFIINGAIEAKQKGIKVSSKEIKVSLFNNFKKLNASKYHLQLRYLNMQEKEIATIWEQVLLFRKYLQSCEIPPETLTKLPEYQKMSVDVYKGPTLSSFDQLMKFQLYISYISGNSYDQFDLPNILSSIDEIEKFHPDLVERSYEITLAKADKKELHKKVSTKSMISWQSKNKDLLLKNFPFLKNQDREKISFSQRSQIDQFSIDAIIESNPEWMREHLGKKNREDVEITISSSGEITPFLSITDIKKFEEFLYTNGCNENLYRDDENISYLVSLKNRGDKKIVSFSKALDKGLLDKPLDAFLEEQYPQVRINYSANFKDDKGDWKPLSDIKELLGVYVFSNLLQKIDIHYQKDTKLSWFEGTGPIDFYLAHRFYKQVKQLHSNEDKQAHLDNPISFWKVDKSQVSITSEHPLYEKAIKLEKGFSPIYPQDNSLCFFYMKDKRIDTELIEKKKNQIRDEFILENKNKVAQMLLEEIYSKQAVVFSNKEAL